MNEILLVLFLLFVKHWYVDFVNQSMDEVQSKGKYGSWLGIWHSIKHGLGTFLIFGLWDITVVGALILGTIDALVHYHVDWSKMNFGNRDITTPQFWNHLGLDQLAHYTTYLILIWMIT
jgi:hypothetical protein